MTVSSAGQSGGHGSASRKVIGSATPAMGRSDELMDVVPSGLVEVFSKDHKSNVDTIVSQVASTSVSQDNVRWAYNHVLGFGDKVKGDSGGFPGYHDVTHSLGGILPVVETLKNLRDGGVGLITDEVLELSIVAQSFHDLGYLKVSGKGHEDISMAEAGDLMKQRGYSDKQADIAKFMIHATKLFIPPSYISDLQQVDDTTLSRMIRQCRDDGLFHNMDPDSSSDRDFVRGATYAAQVMGTFDLYRYPHDLVSKIPHLQKEFADDNSPADAGSGLKQLVENHEFHQKFAMPRVREYGVLNYVPQVYTDNEAINAGVSRRVNELYTKVAGKDLVQGQALIASELHELRDVSRQFGFQKEAEELIRMSEALGKK